MNANRNVKLIRLVAMASRHAPPIGPANQFGPTSGGHCAGIAPFTLKRDKSSRNFRSYRRSKCGHDGYSLSTRKDRKRRQNFRNLMSLED